MRRILDSNDHYEALGFPRHIKIEAVTLKKEYMKKAMLVHPDKNMGSPLASESFKKIQCAFEVLSNFTKKRVYDEHLRKEDSGTGSVCQKSHSTSNQMIVFEAYAGRKTLNQPDDSSQLHELVSSLLCEGVAQNTTGNVFVPKVCDMLMQRSTYEGMKLANDKVGHFVLTRDGFTVVNDMLNHGREDNFSHWEHLRISFNGYSIDMCYD